MSIGSKAIENILWALSKSWGSRLISLAAFLLIARFVTPAEYGLAAAGTLVLSVIQTLCTFGFGEALVQRRDFEDADANLPFFWCLLFSFALGTGVWMAAHQIEELLRMPHLAIVLRSMAPLAVLTHLSIFQEYFYRRDLQFRRLAVRSLIANVLGGAAGVTCAIAGFGVWALVLQAYVSTCAAMLWLWCRPIWTPSTAWRVRSFRVLLAFGSSVLARNVLETAITKTVEILIARNLGPAALGLYAVGSRIYTIMIQLLQGALNDVSLSLVARIAHDRLQLHNAFWRTLRTSAAIGAAVMVFMALTSPEICSIAFGEKWDGAAQISTPLLLLGVVQVVQFFNGTYMSAVGKPHFILFLSTMKAAMLLLVLSGIPHQSLTAYVWTIVAANLSISPLNFYLTSKLIGVKPVEVCTAMAKSYGMIAIAGIAAAMMRWMPLPGSSVGVLLILGTVFAFSYGGLLFVFERNLVTATWARLVQSRQ